MSAPLRKPAATLLCLSLAIALPALAATPEEEYLAARDRYVAKIATLEKGQGGEAAAQAEHEKALADLQERLRGIVGGLAVQGFPAVGRINLESLMEGDLGFGMLDALRFEAPDGEGPAIVVTTEPLLSRWLADWRKREKHAPASTADALRSDLFYTQAVGSEAAFTTDATLDIAKPAGAEQAVALMGSWAQDIGPSGRHQAIVMLRRGGRITIETWDVKARVGRIRACDEIWAAAEKDARRLYAAYVQSHLKDTKLFDQREAVETKGASDFHACFAERAPKESWYPGVVEEATAVAARLAGK